MSISVRKAVANDAAAACDVLRRSIRHLCVADHQNNEGALGAWLANKTPENVGTWVASAQTYCVVAVGEPGVCGFAMVGRDGTIRLCYVAPEVQHLGVGKSMLAALEAEAAGWGLKSTRLESTLSAMSFYERNGYSSAGEPIVVFEAQRAFPMRKSIAL